MADSPYRTITAKYDGHCAECGDPISAGDSIVYDTKSREVFCCTCGEDLE